MNAKLGVISEICCTFIMTILFRFPKTRPVKQFWGFLGSSGKWRDRVVCVVSMLPDEEGKQLKQQVQRITTLRGDKRRYASNKPSARETT